MRLGINYPWKNYGWDFGPYPWAKGGKKAKEWRDVIDQDLAAFKRCGVTIVRWFVLCEGFNCGSGHDAPHREGDRWRLNRVPDLHPKVETDFADLLRRFADAEIQLLPVLIDHKWAFPGLDRRSHDDETLERWFKIPRPGKDKREACLRDIRRTVSGYPEGYVKGGRSDAIGDPDRRTEFYRRVLRPLLLISKRYPQTIYAWELINEPEWITQQRGLGGRLTDSQRIPLDQMLRFIREGLAIIKEYGFRPTVGFTNPRVLGDWEARAARHIRALTPRVLGDWEAHARHIRALPRNTLTAGGGENDRLGFP